MASILKPFKNILSPVRMTPTGALAIDWTHPLANGLIGAWIPGAMGGVDLTGQAPTLAFNSNGGTNVNAEGVGDDGTNTGGNTGLGATATAAFKSWPQTQYWRGSIVNSGAAFGALLLVTYDNAAGNPFAVSGMGSDSGGWNGTTSCFRVQYNFGGTFNSINPTLPFAISPPTSILSFGATFDLANLLLTPYFNGSGFTGTAFASGPTSSATSTINIDAEIGTTRYSGAITNCAYVWNRVLTATEMAALDLSPYAFVIPAGEAEMSAMFQPPPQLPIMGQIWI